MFTVCVLDIVLPFVSILASVDMFSLCEDTVVSEEEEYEKKRNGMINRNMFVLSCRFVLSCLVLSCPVLSCLALSCLDLPCLVLSCLVLSCAVV
jgi:hypothetical protein